jgi:hypothetical protein
MLNRSRGGRWRRWRPTKGLAIEADREALAKGLGNAFSTCQVGLNFFGNGENGSAGARIDVGVIRASDVNGHPGKVLVGELLVCSHCLI